ncbi:MAG: extracellular solute-binding protein [Candidatus Rokubacteria bacterium]|nr:extracellular solute-binding protein [Candidatus Rokubacteria bacterium]MBI2552912.1 extracellular solute-binding protein [Candidatus Rokubacteria bacterium]
MLTLTRTLVIGLALAFWAPSASAATRELVILTSFPKELFEAYKKAFEAARPGVRVVVKPQQTNAAITYLRETRAKPDADIFWASAVDAFQVLKGDGLLERIALPDALLRRIPNTIGTFPIHDPDGHYFGFAVSGYGLMWNTRYLALHKLATPKEWTDLADGRYHGHLVISAPSRSGTTHLTIEVILQAYGWEKGWALLLQMGGNMGSITERSFGVPEAVISGQYGIGVVIDFFGLSAIASGHPVAFAYPSLTSVVPASVAVVKGGPNGDNARAFVEYLLSDEGQLRLFSPGIGRLPVVPDLYAKAPAAYPNLFTMKLGGMNFNDKLSSSRRNVVNSLYDHLITFRHAELKAAWAAIFAAENAVARAKASGKSVAEAERALAEARRLATAMPLDAARASDKELNAAFKDKPEVKSKVETDWDTFAKTNYAQARDAAGRALAAAK